VYGSAPAPPSPLRGPGADEPAPEAAIALADAAEGDARIDSYTVVYDRDGAPGRGIVVARLADGRRALGHTPSDRALLEAFAAAEQVGRRGRMRAMEGANLFDPR
jgi:acetyl-CoA C-acetyltransferase